MNKVSQWIANYLIMVGRQHLENCSRGSIFQDDTRQLKEKIRALKEIEQ